MGSAPTSGFQMGLVQGMWMRMIREINIAPRVAGSWGDYLYETFKSIMTFNLMLMDDNDGEVDLYFDPQGERLEFEISRGRTVVLER